MAHISVQKIEDKNVRPIQLFQEIEKQFGEVRRRAFEMFERRGRELGHALEDWVKAEHEILGWPAAELKEVDSKYELAMTLPGYETKDVQVTATPTEIIIHAKSDEKAGKAKTVWSEFGANDVYRCFGLPESIDVEKTTASLDKGMLHITAAKASKALGKPIEVRAA